MKLHTNNKLFGETIRATSNSTGIKAEFVEKDYWITLVLSQLSKSNYAGQAVFKGGTSLSKGYGLINRFSEDVDIAIINTKNKSGNVIKNLIKNIEKKMTSGLNEKQVEEVSSKGSRFRKSVFEYPDINTAKVSNTIIVEINSFANSVPFQKLIIKSFIYDFFKQTNNENYVEQYSLQPFEINTLNKEQTMMEKLVSLIRFSFAENAIESIASRIRHFYDLYFLISDKECNDFLKSSDFKKQFKELIKHDKELFDIPAGWAERELNESPLIADFDNTWNQLKNTYKTELSAFAYSQIPDEKQISKKFKDFIEIVKLLR